MIVVDGLIFEYPGHRAIDQVSFSIAQNSVVALVGPNGAGKTTLMRCLCGLERPLAGEISVDGVDVIEEPRRSHERIGYLSDFFGLYSELSVHQCLYYAATANGLSDRVEQAVQDTAAKLRLSDRLGQAAGELSRGLRQRVAIGQAMIHRPRVLILDEPASGLDPEARHELAEVFKTLQAGGMTLLVSSHILAELETYASEMLVIREGKIIEHRALTTLPDARYYLRIELCGGAEQAQAILNQHPRVDDVIGTDREIQCQFSGNDEERAGLLAQLINSGVNVAGFAVVEGNLQQSYLATIKQDQKP